MPTPHKPEPISKKPPYWLRRGFTAWLLLPLSALFYLVSSIRKFWLTQIKTPYHPDRPVIVIGNITAGGAGKTPTTIALVQHLKNKGFKPAIVSRGYGRDDQNNCLEVQADASPSQVGDEPLLIKRKTEAPVFVAAKRVEAVQTLLRYYPQTDLIICDDGLQHYALARDIEIIVFDDRGVGNGWLIPAGFMREPLSRVKQTDLVLFNANKPSVPINGHLVKRSLGGYMPLQQWIQKENFSPTNHWKPLNELASQQKMAAVAGIGDPNRFFSMLKEEGMQLTDQVALPDHDDFTQNPFSALDTELIFTTEKDAAKCHAYQNDLRILVVTLTYQLPELFLQQLDQRLQPLIKTEPTSPSTDTPSIS